MNRLILILIVVLILSALPFLILGDAFEQTISEWLSSKTDPKQLRWLIAGALATDIFLPIPSSFVCTLAGERLGPWEATLYCSAGLSAGAMIGYLLALSIGRPIVQYFVKERELIQASQFVDRYGMLAIILSRPAPILAEACLLYVGLAKMPIHKVLLALLPTNVLIAFAYGWLGEFASKQGWLPYALVVATAAPLLLTWALRKRLSHNLEMNADQSGPNSSE